MMRQALVAALLATGLLSAQQPVKCLGPLSEERLTDLIKSQVAEKRLHAFVQTCGVGFELSDAAKGRLRTAGASQELLEDIRVHGPEKRLADDAASKKRQAEQARWESVKDSRSTRALEQFLRDYPDSEHASAARLTITSLKPVVPAATPEQEYQSGKAHWDRKEWAGAIDAFRRAALLGDARAMTFLGFMYEKAQGLVRDDFEAARWYRKAAEAGNPLGMSNLGVMYKDGRGVGKDESEAVRWYRKAAEAGNSEGMIHLGVMFEAGAGVDKDEAEAARWFRKAAEAGNALGMKNLGGMYKYGRGVGKDDFEAVLWYRKAAEAGNTEGMNELGVMLATGTGVAKDEVEAVRWFRKAAEAGNALGMKNLGVAYENGQGVSKDDAEAVRWYRKAAELGEMRAMTSLGFMYENGRGIGKDEAEAVRWYRKAADFGEMRAMTNLGFMYETGRGIGKDEAEAVRWYSKAATGRFPRALYLLGMMNLEGRGGLAKNYAEAVRLINQASEAGFAPAKSWVAKSGGAQPSGPQTQGAPKRITVGGNVQQVKLISQPKPAYPPLAKQARISGVVRFNAIIGRDGTIQSLTSVVGHPLLVPAARDAVKQWRYQPTLIDGEPVEVVTQIEVNFTLNQ